MYQMIRSHLEMSEYARTPYQLRDAVHAIVAPIDFHCCNMQKIMKRNLDLGASRGNFNTCDKVSSMLLAPLFLIWRWFNRW